MLFWLWAVGGRWNAILCICGKECWLRPDICLPLGGGVGQVASCLLFICVFVSFPSRFGLNLMVVRNSRGPFFRPIGHGSSLFICRNSGLLSNLDGDESIADRLKNILRSYGGDHRCISSKTIASNFDFTSVKF